MFYLSFCLSFCLSISLSSGLPGLLSVNGSFPAQAAISPAQEKVSKLINAFVQWDGKTSDRARLDEAAKYIDYENMAQRALGFDQWCKLSVKQKSNFVLALKNAIEQRYYPRWHRLFAKGTITYGSLTADETDTTVETVLTLNKTRQKLSWLLTGKKGDCKVVSLKVDKNDLLTRLHERISARLEKSGFANVLAWLQSKSAEISDDVRASGEK